MRPSEINALHCISCTQVMCNLCGKCIQGHHYYLHFYLPGVNSDLKEKAKLCPFRTLLDRGQDEKFPCEVCSNGSIKENCQNFVKRVGIKHRNFLNEKTMEVTSILTDPGKDILVCPYNDRDVKSTICPLNAVIKLAKRVNAGLNPGSTEYIRLNDEYRELSHKTTFDHMCQLKKHLHLHEDRRVDIHIVELTLAEAYKTPDDLSMIDTLLKMNIEKFEQVSKISAIIPAYKCLGFNDQFHVNGGQGWSWLAVVDPECLDVELPASPGLKYIHDPEINSIMDNIEKENKTVYMIIHTHEGLLENPVEYFEDLPLFPEWVKEIKLLFTWNVKEIIMEENRSMQESLIKGKFIHSKRYPSYLMKLINSEICDCDSGFCKSSPTHAINENHIKPVNDCSLPLIISPLQVTTTEEESKLDLWERMFKFAWREINSSEETNSSFDSESDSSDSSDSSGSNKNIKLPWEHETDCNEGSDDVWPDL